MTVKQPGAPGTQAAGWILQSQTLWERLVVQKVLEGSCLSSSYLNEYLSGKTTSVCKTGVHLGKGHIRCRGFLRMHGSELSCGAKPRLVRPKLQRQIGPPGAAPWLAADSYQSCPWPCPPRKHLTARGKRSLNDWQPQGPIKQQLEFKLRLFMKLQTAVV